MTDSNNSWIASLLGRIFHGCWHHYSDWSEPKSGYRSAVYQEKECIKCGRIQHRIISYDGGVKKPERPPQVESTPQPPTSGKNAD